MVCVELLIGVMMIFYTMTLVPHTEVPSVKRQGETVTPCFSGTLICKKKKSITALALCFFRHGGCHCLLCCLSRQDRTITDITSCASGRSCNNIPTNVEALTKCTHCVGLISAVLEKPDREGGRVSQIFTAFFHINFMLLAFSCAVSVLSLLYGAVHWSGVKSDKTR